MRRSCTQLGLVALALLLGAPTSAASPLDAPTVDPIVGGVDNSAGEFDAVVSIRTSGQLCTGTLVSPTVILTAAHCLEEESPSASLTVYFGDEEDSDLSMIATRFGLHPQYCDLCQDDRFDFAFVELPQPYNPSDGLLLPIVDQREWDEAMRLGNVVLLTGFGTDDPTGQEIVSTAVKRKVSTTITDFTQQGSEFYAGGGGRDTCSGDSGGPAIALLGSGARRLAGVTSRGSVPCGNGGWYGVPFRALQWLQSETDVDLLPPGCELATCLDTAPASDDEGRCSVGTDGTPTPWLLVLLGLLERRRRRSRRAAK